MATKKTYQFRPAGGVARVTNICLGVIIGLNVYGALVYLLVGAVGDYDADASDLSFPQALQVFADLGQLLAFLLVVPLLLWIYRTSANAHALQPRMKHSVPASIYWYLVPLASLILPFEAAKEVWKVSSPGRSVAKKDDGLLRVWWTLFIANNVFSIMAGASKVTVIRGLYCLVGAALAVVLILMVRRLLSLQTAAHLSENFGEAEPISILEAQTA